MITKVIRELKSFGIDIIVSEKKMMILRMRRLLMMPGVLHFMHLEKQSERRSQ